MKTTIRLSQCMIVKNEEKNIKRALSWGKNIVCEQIVVDTGSSDRTVDIAKEMGAKVYSFTWINDFSAAKNFAVDIAKGNWIAFLDADEYFESEDVDKIIPLLTWIEENYSSDKKNGVVRSTLVNLNDSGSPDSVGIQDRLFRNTSELRYQYKLHEVLCVPKGSELCVFDAVKKLTIFHTGYTAEIYKETGKAKRNIAILEDMVADEPDNYNLWSYMGDSYFANDNLEKAKEIYLKVIENLNESVLEERRNAAICNLLKINFMIGTDNKEETYKIYEKSLEYECKTPDAEYWLGRYLFQNGYEREGAAYFELALEKIEKYNGAAVLAMTSSLPFVYQTLFNVYKTFKHSSLMVKYGVLALRMDRYIETILKDLLKLLKKESKDSGAAKSIFSFLSKIYSYSSLKDKLFLIKVIKTVPFPVLEDLIYELLTEQEKKFFNKKEQSPYYLSEEVREKKYPEFHCENETDQEFLNLLNEVCERQTEELFLQLKTKMEDLECQYKNVKANFIKTFSRFPNWGELDSKEDRFGPLKQRIIYAKTKADDLIWLYMKLADYQSKKVLISILRNWIFLDTKKIGSVKKEFEYYYDLDLIPSGKNQVFVDAGAFNGDTVRSYIKSYGEQYKKIYCYEAFPDMFESLKRNLRNYSDIEYMPGALDSGEAKMYINIDEDEPKYSWVSGDKGNITVAVTTLDQDIKEKIDFIKLDINGNEKQALAGAMGHIKVEQPKLLVALYHRIYDLTEIPRLIYEEQPDYKFYLRYYGGDLIPTHIMLYAV